jgi:phosphoserine phosphatase RsbX
MNISENEKMKVIAYQSSKNGNDFCGDSYFYTLTEDFFICVLADGLGSGEFAYQSSQAVVSVVKQYQDEELDQIMKRCNEVLLEKRGAAVSIIKFRFSTKDFIYSGVGNIRFFLYSPEGQLTYPISVTGYLSGRPQNYHTQHFKYEPNSKFILHTDGLQIGARSLLQKYFQLDCIAQDIEKNYVNLSDDATFIIGSLQ